MEDKNTQKVYYTKEQMDSIINALNHVEVHGASVIQLAIVMQLLSQSKQEVGE